MLSFVRATDILAKSLWIHVDTNLPPQSFISYIEYDCGEQHLATLQFSLTSHVSDSLPGTDFYRQVTIHLNPTLNTDWPQSVHTSRVEDREASRSGGHEIPAGLLGWAIPLNQWSLKSCRH